MSVEANPQNTLESVVRAFGAGDAGTAIAAMSPGIAWHSPGRRQPAAGSHVGIERVTAAFGAIADQPGELELEIVDAMAGRGHEIVLYRHRRRRPDAHLDANICLVARLEDGKLSEVWEHIYDVHEFDEFYGGGDRGSARR